MRRFEVARLATTSFSEDARCPFFIKWLAPLGVRMKLEDHVIERQKRHTLLNALCDHKYEGQAVNIVSFKKRDQGQSEVMRSSS